MRHLLIMCLLNLPILAFAENSETVIVPEPPEVSKPVQSGQPLTPDPSVNGAPEAPPQAMPEQPDLPSRVHSGENLEPDITIVRGKKKTIQEYRRNGELYMVKIIPDKGPAYYLIDVNGDGKLDVRGSDLDKGLNINMWKLLEWD